MSQEQKKRLYKVLWIVGGGVLAVVAYALFYHLVGFGLPCVWYTTTGFQCAGCGMTRAAAALINLDFKTAFAYNAAWPLYVGYVLWVVPAITIPYVKKGTPLQFPKPMWINYTILGGIFVFGIVRNLV